MLGSTTFDMLGGAPFADQNAFAGGMIGSTGVPVGQKGNRIDRS